MIRREYLKMIAMGAGATALTGFKSSELAENFSWDGRNILFQGDSITDAGRNRENSNPNSGNALGAGYSLFATANLLEAHPDADFQIYNRGISGNKVFQLQERWEQDCIELEPDLLSILIGVNDFWHTLSFDYEGTVEVYENDLRSLISETLDKLPNLKIIICEPFIVEGGTAITEEWYPSFSEYQKVSKKLSVEFNTGFVPFQAYFDKALEEAPASYWCPDGVHPSIAGSQLMAYAWLKTFKATVR